jgi:hypothetical protein
MLELILGLAIIGLLAGILWDLEAIVEILREKK